MLPIQGMRPPTALGSVPPDAGGSNSMYSPGGRVPSAGDQNPMSQMKRVGWQQKGNRNPSGFGGPISNPDSGGGTNINMRAPRATAGGVIGPGPSGSSFNTGFARLA